MGFIKRLFGGAPEQRAVTDAELMDLLHRGPTAAGINMTSEVALQSPTVLAAVRAISETSGMLPIAVRQKEGSGWKKISDHPVARLLNDFSNPWTAATDLRTQLCLDAILNKNGGFARVIRARGEPRELQRLNPTAVSIRIDLTSGEPSYEISRPTGGPLVLSYKDVVHFTVPGWCHDRPMALIEKAREVIALDIVMDRNMSRTFSKSGLPQMILAPKSDDTGPDALKKALQFFNKQAEDNTGDPIILPAPFESAITTVGYQQMQAVEIRRLVIERIATALKVPGPIVGDLTRGTYSNSEQAARNFLILSLLPYLEMMESAFTRALIPPEDRDSLEIEFVTADLMRGDTAARMRAYRDAGGGAHLTINEIRDMEGYPPHPDGDGLIKQAGQSDRTDRDRDNPDEPEAAPVA